MPVGDCTAIGRADGPTTDAILRARDPAVALDAFYAPVEQRDRPERRGKLVIVGGSRRRGVVLAASYEARPFGCRTAMPMAEAIRLCPQAIIVPPRMEAYVVVSEKFREVLDAFTLQAHIRDATLAHCTGRR